MSDREMDDQEWEELLKRTVIQHYATTAADITYNPDSWNQMKQKIEHKRIARSRKYKAHSFVISIASAILFVYVFAGPAQTNSIHPFTRIIHDVKRDVSAYLEKLEKMMRPMKNP